jgi:hypothetical protein
MIRKKSVAGQSTNNNLLNNLYFILCVHFILAMAEVGHSLPFHGLLSKLYYDADQRSAYTSKKTVYEAAKKIDASITHKNVNDWFSSQPAATWKQPKLRPHRNPYVQV